MLVRFEVHLIARAIFSWMLVVSFLLCISVSGNSNAKFFRIGPHDDLMLFGLAIDTAWRYFWVFSYTCISTIVRTFQQEVMRPWIIQQIQNERQKNSYVIQHAYFVVGVETIFIWFDWFMYINILLAQIDLMIVEMVGNIIATFYTTNVYLKSSGTTIESNVGS